MHNGYCTNLYGYLTLNDQYYITPALQCHISLICLCYITPEVYCYINAWCWYGVAWCVAT